MPAPFWYTRSDALADATNTAERRRRPVHVYYCATESAYQPRYAVSTVLEVRGGGWQRIATVKPNGGG
jgi:hypothetical protein